MRRRTAPRKLLEALGQIVKRRRDYLGLTWVDVQERAGGLSAATYAKVESGSARAGGRTYARLENALGYAHGSFDVYLDGGAEPALVGATAPLPVGPDRGLARVVQNWPLLCERDQGTVVALIGVMLEQPPTRPGRHR